MKAALVAGALAALVYGTTAGAQSEPTPQSPEESGQDAEAPRPRQNGDERQVPDLGVADDFGYEQEGVGGAGEANGVDTEPGLAPDEFTEYDVQLVPVMPAPGIIRPDTGFTSRQAELLRGTGIFGARVAMAPSGLFEPEPLHAQDVGVADFQVGEMEEEEAIGGAGLAAPAPSERADMRGVTLLIGGGIEGYTENLASVVDPGGTAGVSASLRPSSVFGFEVGYSGALNEVDKKLVGEVRDGVDIVRNGGHAALTMGLSATPLQPYVLGGVGVSFYNIRNGEAAGFQDDTVGTVPVGLGVRSHLGKFTADARVNYNFLFGQQFAPAEGGDDTAGSYTGTINLGGTF